MYKKATIFIICMIIGMAIYVVMDYFIVDKAKILADYFDVSIAYVMGIE